MKIVNPSATIIEDDLSQLSIYQRIAYCAGVCYQREPRKTEEEAQAFCRRMVEIGHHATLEMAVVHIATPGNVRAFEGEKYLHVSDNGKLDVYISGSIRAFIESENPAMQWIKGDFMADNFPLFFERGEKTYKLDVRFAEPHEVPWQHRHVAVRFIVNRAVSHELVRHRPCSFLQESQRYCRYSDEVVFIKPLWSDTGNANHDELFEYSSAVAEGHYRTFLKRGLKPQQARAVLPNSTKTELIIYASLPQWKHIFSLRCSPAADPEMLRVMRPLREEFMQRYAEAFTGSDDL
jgi:thymidylate synthase (FAD)